MTSHNTYDPFYNTIMVNSNGTYYSSVDGSTITLNPLDEYIFKQIQANKAALQRQRAPSQNRQRALSQNPSQNPLQNPLQNRQRALSQNPLQNRQRAPSQNPLQNRQRALSQNLQAPSQNLQVRQRSASQQIENYSKSINTLLDNAAETLKTATESPKAAVYAHNSENIQKNLEILLAKNQQNEQTHTFYFCFTFQDAGMVKAIGSPGKTKTYRLIVYKPNKQEKQEFKIGYMDDDEPILGVKEERHIIGNDDLEASRLMKYAMKPAMETIIEPGKNSLSLDNLFSDFKNKYTIVKNKKVNLKDLIIQIIKKGGIKFVPIVLPSNSGGYRKKHTRRHRKIRTVKNKYFIRNN